MLVRLSRNNAPDNCLYAKVQAWQPFGRLRKSLSS
jgi:hypothetical protein